MTATTPRPVEVSDVGRELTRFFRGFKSVQVQMSHRAKHGVDPSAYAVLFQLVESPKRTTNLASCLHADTSTVSRQVTGLVDLGLIERTADPDDGRAALLAVTPAGLAVLDDMRRAREQMISHIVGDWPAASIADLVTLLGKFNDDFDEARPAIIADLSKAMKEH